MDVNPVLYRSVQLRDWLRNLGLRSSGTKAEMALRLSAVPLEDRGEAPPRDDDEIDAEDDEVETEDGDAEIEDGHNRETALVRREMNLVKRERDLLLRENEVLKEQAALARQRGSSTSTTRSVDSGCDQHLSLNIIKDMLANFDGNSNFEFWKAQVKGIGETYKLNENVMRALITTKLTGKALKWLHSNINCATSSVDELWDSLTSAFRTKENKLMLRRRFEERIWKVAEPFKDYYEEKNAMANDIQMDEEELIDHLIEGIPNKQLQTQAYLQCFTSKSQLVKAFERIPLKAERRVEQKSAVDKCEIRCYNCNSIGHYASSCLKPRRQMGACYGCGGSDHQVVSCPDRKKAAMLLNDNDYVRVFKFIFSSDNNKFVCLESLIDSGSPVSFARKSVLPEEITLNLNVAVESEYYGINKSKLKYYGETSCLIIVENKYVEINFLIVADEAMSYDVVLGRDFLHKSGSKLKIGFDNEKELAVTQDNIYFKKIFEMLRTKDRNKKTNYENNVKIEQNEQEVIEKIDCNINDRRKKFEGELVIGRDSCCNSSKIDSDIQKSEVSADAEQSKAHCKAQLGGENSEYVHVVKDLMNISHSTSNDFDLVIGDVLTFEQKGFFLENFDKHYVQPTRPQKPKIKCEMEILLNDPKPFNYAPRRISYAERGELQKLLDEYLKKDIIRPSDSEYASPIVLVKKKTGELRMCVDFRKLNKVTAKDNYPLPLIDDLLDRLNKKTIFTKLDLKNGFFHVFMSAESVKYTSFVTPLGQFEFLRMPFGLRNAPSKFQRFVNKIFADMIKEDKVILYMDDIMIASENLEDHMVLLEEVFKRLVENKLELRLDKCEFFQSEVRYLGYAISGHGIKADEKGLAAVRDFPVPEKVVSVQSFLGLCSYFRRFVKNFSILAKPLYDLTRKDVAFKFGSRELECFELLKNKMVNSPVLSIYDPNHETELHCDASSLGFGAILLQKKDDGKFHPIFYFSKRTTSLEAKYHSFELETLAIIYALKRFRIYLLGRRFKIVTDCNSLALTLNKKDLNPRIARWALELQNYDYSLEHRKNGQMQHVDALSRCVMVIETNTLEENLIICQGKDKTLQELQKTLESAESKFYEMRNGVVYRKTNKGTVLFCVPKNMEKQVIFKFHDEMGHLGIDKVVELISKSYWFPKLRNKVAEHTKNCLKCIIFSSKPGREEGFLHIIPKSNKPFDVVHIDHYGPIDNSVKAKKHILVVVDAFSKFVRLYCTKTTKTVEVKVALSDYFRAYSRPKTIVSDRGSCFTSAEFSDFLLKNNVQHVKIATGSPQANGQVERINRSIGPMISKLVDAEERKPWTSVVETVEFSLNNTLHRAVGHHPSVLLFGVGQRGKATDVLQEKILDMSYKKTKRLNIKKIRATAARKQLRLQVYNKNYADKKRQSPRTYKVGDYVLIKNFDSHVGAARKLIPKFKGPYKVAKTLRNDRYLLKDVDGFQQSQIPYIGVWAVGNIRPWINENIEKTKTKKVKANEKQRSGDLKVRMAEL